MWQENPGLWILNEKSGGEILLAGGQGCAVFFVDKIKTLKVPLNDLLTFYAEESIDSTSDNLSPNLIRISKM